MTQITSIKLGLIAMCIATVPLSLAQRPRTGTSGSNQTGVTAPALPGHSGLPGNSTSVGQLGTNPPSSMITAPNTNAGAHIGINPAVQTGISNPTGGIVGGPAMGLSGSSGNSTGATQTGANARAGTNTPASTNAGTRAAAAAATPAGVATILPQLTPMPIQSPSPNSNFSTAGQSPSPVPSASVSPTPTPTPVQSL
jgi:hypothetical protein